MARKTFASVVVEAMRCCRSSAVRPSFSLLVRATARDFLAGALRHDLAVLRGGGTASGADPLAVELFDGFLQGFLGLLGQVTGFGNRVKDGGVRAKVVEETALEAQDILDLDVIEVAVRAHPNRGDLVFHRVGRGLGCLSSSMRRSPRVS